MPNPYRSSSEDTTRTVVIDDRPEIRMLARHMLAHIRGVRIIAEGGNGQDAIELAERLQPELMILDVEMPVLSGLDALPQVLARSPHTKVIIWTSAPNACPSCAEMGAFRIVPKGTDPQLITDAVRDAVAPRGGPY